MFRLFRKRKQTNTDGSQGKLVQWLTERIMCIKKRWAGYMQRRMEKLSLRGKKITVIALCLVSGGYCSWIIYQSFHTGHTKIFSVTSIQKPAHVTETGEASIENGVVISEAEYKRITDFRKSMDSLTASTAGKRIADSILFLRPGLMDSIYRFEQLYQLQQLKTK